MVKTEKQIAAIKAALEKRKADENLQKHMKIYEAQTLVDKNSRTAVKIMQLLDLIQAPNITKVDPDGYVLERIEKLKKRYLRRLSKLATWSDAPEMERIPKFHSLRVLPSNKVRNPLPQSSQMQQQQKKQQHAQQAILLPQRQSSRLSNSSTDLLGKVEETVESIKEEGGGEDIDDNNEDIGIPMEEEKIN